MHGGYPVYLTLFVEDTTFSLLCILVFLPKISWLYTLGLYLSSLLYFTGHILCFIDHVDPCMSSVIFNARLFQFLWCHNIVWNQGNVMSPALSIVLIFHFFFFFAFVGFLMCFYRNFRNPFFISTKSTLGILIEIAFNLQIALGDMDILTILILLIQDRGIFFPGIEYCV